MDFFKNYLALFSGLENDFNYVGTWPLPVRYTGIFVVCLLVFGGGLYFDTADQLSQLDGFRAKEVELIADFEVKQKKSTNLENYKDQFSEIEDQLYEVMRQVPTHEEVADLLIDITKAGLNSGLEFKLFKPGSPVKNTFYSELPIVIQVIGSYDQLGLFVSRLASLSRIVTVGDISIQRDSIATLTTNKGVDIKPDIKSNKLIMNATIKTYNENPGEAMSGKVNKKKKGGINAPQ